MLTGKTIFFAISAIAILYLVMRIVRRNRAARLAARHAPLPSAGEMAAGVGTASLDIPSASTVEASASAPPPLSIVKQSSPPPLPPIEPAPALIAASAVAPGSNGAVYSASPESRAYRSNSWSERSLFQDDTLATPANPLPSLRPDEVPNPDLSGCTFGRATPMLAAFLPESPERREIIKKELQSAGQYHPYAWHNLASLRYVLLMGSIVLFGVLLLLAPRRFEMPIIAAGVACAIIGWAVPRLMIRSQAASRLSEIERAIPDMLDMLNMSVSQGMTVQESLGRISSQMKPVYPALAQELQIVSHQASVGSLEQALVNFANRIDLPEVHSFTTLIIQTERMGTSISDALQQYSDNMRDSLRQRADEKANAASFRLLFPTVLFLMPAVFIVLLGPAIVELSDFFTGRGRETLVRNRQQAQEITNRPSPTIPQP